MPRFRFRPLRLRPLRLRPLRFRLLRTIAIFGGLLAFLSLSFQMPVRGQFTDPLSGMQFETMALANMSLMLSLSQRSVFYQSVPLRLTGNRGNRRSSGPDQSSPPASTNVSSPMSSSAPPSYRTTDFRPRRRQSVARQFAALATGPEQRDELLQLGEAVFAELENNPDFRRNNLSYALALAIGAAVGIERGTDLTDEESDFLLRSVHELLTSDPQLMRRPPAELTSLYDTCLLFTGLMVTFHADAQQNRRRESEVTARRLAGAILKAVGWPSEVEVSPTP